MIKRWTSTAVVVYDWILKLVLLYKIWADLGSAYGRTTSGKAVGLMFVPVFNLYWLFQTRWGSAVDFNSKLRAEGLDVRRVPEAIPLVACICTVLGIVPLLGVIAAPTALVLWIIFYWQAIDRMNAARQAVLPTLKAVVTVQECLQ